MLFFLLLPEVSLHNSYNAPLSCQPRWSPCPSIDDFRQGFQDREWDKLEKALRGLEFRVIHRGDVRQRFKILGLTRESAQNRLFTKDEVETDVATYFFKTYGRRLAYPFLPCVKARRDTYLPMEVCAIIEASSLQCEQTNKFGNPS